MIRMTAALLGLATLTACGPLVVATPLAPAAPVVVAGAPTESALAAQIATGVAAQLSPKVGTDFGGGVTITRAEALGSSVLIDMRLPIATDTSSAQSVDTLTAAVRDSFVTGLCEGPETQEFFDLGGQLQLTVMDSNGGTLDVFTVRSCG